MNLPRWGFAALLVIAAVATWLLLIGPAQVFGFDSGNVGVVVLIAVAWVSLIAVGYWPRTGIETEISPGEWRAWVALGFTAVIAAYSLIHAHVFQGPPLWQNPDANRIGRTIALMVIAWAILAQVLNARWRGQVQQDERDHEIETRASGWARGTLSVFAIGLALLLAFSPAEKLTWAPAPMVAHLIIIGLIASCLVEYAVTAVSYWRDRH